MRKLKNVDPDSLTYEDLKGLHDSYVNTIWANYFFMCFGIMAILFFGTSSANAATLMNKELSKNDPVVQEYFDKKLHAEAYANTSSSFYSNFHDRQRVYATQNHGYGFLIGNANYKIGVDYSSERFEGLYRGSDNNIEQLSKHKSAYLMVQNLYDELLEPYMVAGFRKVDSVSERNTRSNGYRYSKEVYDNEGNFYGLGIRAHWKGLEYDLYHEQFDGTRHGTGNEVFKFSVKKFVTKHLYMKISGAVLQPKNKALTRFNFDQQDLDRKVAALQIGFKI